MSNEKLSHLVNRTDIGLLHLDNVQIDRLLCRLQGVLRMGTDVSSEELTYHGQPRDTMRVGRIVHEIAPLSKLVSGVQAVH